jgi:L-iditol 2-dehydrogenase
LLRVSTFPIKVIRFHLPTLPYRLPHSISPDEGALLEPLSVGVYSCQRAGLKVGDNLLICGAGPIGLVTVMAAKVLGARNICITGELKTNMRKPTAYIKRLLHSSLIRYQSR